MGGEAAFGFGDAIKYVKRGLKLKRKGWNGKNQYIQLAIGISYQDASGDIINCEHEAIGNMAIAFVGTSGVQMGWLASQADMLAEDAIKYVKRGLKLKRKGWNGKKQYIQLATGISYKDASGDIINCEHDAIGNMAIAFVGTSGVQMGWLASQADMLAEDWVFAD